MSRQRRRAKPKPKKSGEPRKHYERLPTDPLLYAHHVHRYEQRLNTIRRYLGLPPADVTPTRPGKMPTVVDRASGP